MPADDPRSPQQPSQNLEAVRRDARTADEMQKARLKEEAKPAQAVMPPPKAEAIDPPEAPVTKPGVAKKPAYFTAVSPKKAHPPVQEKEEDQEEDQPRGPVVLGPGGPGGGRYRLRRIPVRARREPPVLEPQRLPALDMRGVDRDARHRANLDALGLAEMAHALGTAGGIDLVDFRSEEDGLVRALGLADIAVDALVGNHQRHSDILPRGQPLILLALSAGP
jgi:hypothetical protein